MTIPLLKKKEIIERQRFGLPWSLTSNHNPCSTNHIRRSLQVLPFPSADDRLATLCASSSLDVVGVSLDSNGKKNGKKKEEEKHGNLAERRRKIDHLVPAIGIPDEKTNSCMRCGRTFGWRLQDTIVVYVDGCVCASCSGRVSRFPFNFGPL